MRPIAGGSLPALILLVGMGEEVLLESLGKREGGQAICPMNYDPVCGELEGKRRTFGNRCVADGLGAKKIMPGRCDPSR